MAKKKIKKLSKKRSQILLKRKRDHRNVEGQDFIYKPSGTKSPTPEASVKHFNSSRHGCECELLEDGRIYTTSKSPRGPKGGLDKPGGVAKP